MISRVHEEYPRDKPVHTIFDDVCAQAPEAPAIRLESGDRSYESTRELANRTANYLLTLGVGPGEVVALLLDRSEALVVFQLAILKVGAVYLPIDMNAPHDRVAFFVKDANVSLLLFDSRRTETPAFPDVRAVDLHGAEAAIDASSSDAPGIVVDPLAPAYIMYTSGSTGVPKGVVIPHRGITRLVRQQSYFPAGPDQCTLLLASPGFDGTTYEIYSALLNGGCCAVFEDRHLELARLEHVIRSLRVTCAWFSTGLFNQVLDQRPSAIAALKHALVGGEALSAPHMTRAMQAMPEVQFGNGYGPTECTTLAVSWVLGPPEQWGCESVPLGFPLAHTDCVIVRDNLELADEGEVGELLLGGDGLALGYLNRPEVTAERFIANPFSSDASSRLYRTGDRCYWLPNGMIAYVGRNDDQIKINGFRIELGEVESAVRAAAGVENGAVVVHDFPSGSRGLIGCVVLASGDRFDETSLLEKLEERLPHTMMPSRVLPVPTLPLTINGKVDRRALSRVVSEQLGAEASAAGVGFDDDAVTSSVEREIVKAWRSILNDPNASRESDFYRSGGDSLLANELELELERRLGRSIPGGTVHRYRTPVRLLTWLQSQAGAAPKADTSCKKPQLFVLPSAHGFGRTPDALRNLIEGVYVTYDGLRFPPVDESLASQQSVEKVAEILVPQVLAASTGQVRVLMGYSFAGYVAFEVARQLHAMGEPAPHVILWDAVPESFHRRSLLSQIGLLSKKLLTPSGWSDRRWFRDRFGYLSRRLNGPTTQPQTAAEREKTKGDVERFAEKIIWRYQPGVYSGRVSLLFCKAPDDSLRFAPVNVKKAWTGALSRELLTVYEMDCHHNDVLSHPFVGRFAEQTVAILRMLEKEAIGAGS